VSAAHEPAVDYSASGIAVRDDLRDAHRGMLEHLRRPGVWLDGAQRLALAAESRRAADCPLCRERKASLSPEHARGEHARGPAAAALPETLVEVAHRVRVDSGRLSRAWFERLLDAGLGVGAYVEAVGIVAFVAGIDAFSRALGAPPLALPAPLPGAPSRHRPEGLEEGIAWVPILTPASATGPEADLYPEGFVPNIVRALSSVPDHVRVLKENNASHYVPLDQMGDPKAARSIDRLQIELVAARVSALNECFY
jgi:hypothetical protein